MNPNQNDPQANIEQRILTMRILWFAMLLSIAIYYVMTFFVGRSEDLTEKPSLSVSLLGAGVSTTLISFLIKSKLLTKAVEQRNVGMVQQAYILTWAITEVAALLGLLDYFSTSHRHYYLLFLIAACGMLLHFPRREPVENAAFKSSI
jgi:magnesium-transporting ATPase (P-type)